MNRSGRLIGRRLALVLLGVVVPVLLVEAGVRLRQWIRYGTAFDLIALVVDDETGLRIPRPGHRTRSIQINSLGFRGPELEVPKPPGRLRIAFLGGSTTYCAESSSNAATWPDLVVQQLRERFPQVEFDYVNAGTPGYSTEHSLRGFGHRVAPLLPDVVVIYHATNDISYDTRQAAGAAGLYEEEPEEVRESWLTSWSLTWSLLQKNFYYRHRSAAEGVSGSFLEMSPDQLASGFAQRLGDLVDAAAKVAPLVAVATFSYQARPDQSPEVQQAACASSLYYMPYMSVPSLLQFFASYNLTIRAVAADRGIVLIGDEDSIPADRVHFNDAVHLLDPGCQIMAARVVRHLVDAPGFAQIIEQARSPREG